MILNVSLLLENNYCVFQAPCPHAFLKLYLNEVAKINDMPFILNSIFYTLPYHEKYNLLCIFFFRYGSLLREAI